MFLLAMTFYRSLIAFLLLLPLAVPVCRAAEKRKKEKEDREFLLQFRELLGSLLTGLRAGLAAENAFRDAAGDMAFLFGENSRICREVNRINLCTQNHIPLEKALQDFAERSGEEEIREFAAVFSISKRSGGNLASILERTIRIIQERISTENEISVMLSAKRMEARIMYLILPVLVGYLSLTSPGFLDPMYGSPKGVAVMSVCLVLYLCALAAAEHITDISV